MHTALALFGSSRFDFSYLEYAKSKYCKDMIPQKATNFSNEGHALRQVITPGLPLRSLALTASVLVY